jgi:ABC-2 type transport system ATP-binding protein
MITLSAQHIHKQFGHSVALQDASLEMNQGEILALLGPNGAGKTTLIKILSTLLNKDSGKVHILGYDLDQDEETIRHLIGYVGQDTERSAYARLTVWENLLFFGTLRGMDESLIRSQVNCLVDYFDFNHQLDKLFVSLSGGQKQTVVIMRALLHNPPILYLDEPTKGLDPVIARRIRSFLKHYVNDQGKTMLLTSHILSEVEEMADRVALIQDGQIPVTGTPRELKKVLGANEFFELEKAGLPDETQEHLKNLPIVRCQLERQPGWISFGVDDSLTGAEEILKVLHTDQVRVSFRHHSASLEDTFLYHFGKLHERLDA